jgi:hypothetical protein
VGRDAQRQSGIADRGEIGLRQIFLAKMQVFRSGDNGRAPVIVDHQLRICALRDRERIAHDLQRRAIVKILGAQLHRADTKCGEARDPGDAVDDGIEAVRIRHARTGSR